MDTLQKLVEQFGYADCRDLGANQLGMLRDGLKSITPDEVSSVHDGESYIDLLKKFREAIAENDKLHGDNYPLLLNAILSVGEDGLYSNNLRFIFELIQNVDDCDYQSSDDCRLDMRFDFNKDEIVLTYNEVGFTPFNVFAITGIAEAAKNISSGKNEIGEKGIGFKSVFGVAKRVLIRSGWFSFELYKDNFTIPVAAYHSSEYYKGSQMTLYVGRDRAKKIYKEIKKQYCKEDALFSNNPLLFLNKLTALKIYSDKWRSMEFHVSRPGISLQETIQAERDVTISVDLNDYDENGFSTNVKKQINCSRYSYPVVFSMEACRSRYGERTQVGKPDGKHMILQAILPNQEHLSDVGMGSLYSFLPTQLKLTVPLVCHVPFKLDASREFVDPQDENLWFREAAGYLAELIDYAYLDWRIVVREDILRYLPGSRESLFASNNGKEHCLRHQDSFSGAHYMDLPLFLTTDGKYHTAEDVVCFNPDEHIAEPETVYNLLDCQNYLFLPTVSVRKFWFHTEDNIKDRLFKRALFKETAADVTDRILDYLDSAGYEYSEKTIINLGSHTLTPNQIEIIFKHSKLASVIRTLTCSFVQKNMQPRISVVLDRKQSISEILSDDFQLSDTPWHVISYMKKSHENCICLDIGEDDFLPCSNAVVLSKHDPLASFAAFCYAIDKRGLFAARIKWRDASRKLDQYVERETGSASEFLSKLREIRLSLKDVLGSNGYKSYIDLILKSGTDRERFIQEILQNADDCAYPSGVVPTFSLTLKEKTVITEYNEIGFNRDNIRAITAIGESTKNRLLSGQQLQIGEKGAGFKTIFAMASEVRIRSGEYAFTLTDREPTIPKSFRPSEQEHISGTRMEIVLKDKNAFPSYSEKTILELCLCLRKLRSIRIGNHTVSIKDQDNKRIVAIDNRQYVFKRIFHHFVVADENALKERRDGTRAISSEQTITCFVPEKGGHADYALYNGLPTKHRIKIPMAIDAPFALTTSREEIETECSAWNTIIRKELYTAITKVIDALKTEERERVLRFARFVPRLSGNTRVYINDMSDCAFLTAYDYLSVLKSKEILPTFDKTVFAIPQRKDACRFPEAANILFKTVPQSQYAGILPSTVIDVESSDYDAALNAFGCEPATFFQAFRIVSKHAERYIRQDDFREKLYEFLQEAPPVYEEQIQQMAIIPVYGKIPDSVEYIPWEEDSIFVKKGAVTSSSDYYVLNEKLISKSVCEKIFGSNINEINADWERNRYNERLFRIVHGSDTTEIYRVLISEFRSGALIRYNSFATLYALSEMIPLKNELGEIVDTRLFICDQPSGYFVGDMIRQMIVHKECDGFARFMKCRELSSLHYEDIDYNEMLTEDDLETLQDDYFINSEEILRGFYRDGLLSDTLLDEYGLGYLAFGRMNEAEDKYEFPSDPVLDRSTLREHVRKQMFSPVKVISVREERLVQKGQNKDGSTFDLGAKEARIRTLQIYTPEGAHQRCFCQMCRVVKPYGLMEVNNIELLPKYYFPQLRVSLCLDCSKRFEAMRANDKIRTEFQENIKKAFIQNKGTMDVPIGNEDTVTFTAKHLAEVQEILLQLPNLL